MNRRAEEIKKRIAKRKRDRLNWQNPKTTKKETPLFAFKEEISHSATTSSYFNENQPKGIHPLFRSDIFVMKLLMASCLVLITAIIYKNGEGAFQKAQLIVENVMEEEFHFAAVSKWYEERFGSPIAFFSPNPSSDRAENSHYAVPASGQVLESFKDNGQGVTIQTTKKIVEAMNEGIVIEAGKKEKTGLTVIVQHADGTETWYGNLKEIDVALYDFVEMGAPIGQVNQNENEQGTYYFAIKKGDQFIDPNQVISFD